MRYSLKEAYPYWLEKYNTEDLETLTKKQEKETIDFIVNITEP